ncbi:hypothetical protein ASPWEDRAFT_42296 [Aspergillus wentii DTO 134E9]|uniref:Secreted protein n=1 Tax=Aspergillus wentii DTO 134E9 TaxID=1073089 RepID=A0A1L9RHE6_ASPWE|nr:uncharacterized protein ASPWEDRAFT_42296 [Aspergillus wentii DTO 134E9]OJJ34324.1 hypothetical protein ASPWEDRAFT_42296 [Aspergillus wentii DTO 134E9]
MALSLFLSLTGHCIWGMVSTSYYAQPIAQRFFSPPKLQMIHNNRLAAVGCTSDKAACLHGVGRSPLGSPLS